MAGRVTEAAAVAAVAVVLTIVIAAPVLRSPHERIFGRESVGRHHDPFTVMEQFDRPLSFGVYLQPVTDVPGLNPRSPVTVVGPVLVTVEPASTAKAAAAPRETGRVALSGELDVDIVVPFERRMAPFRIEPSMSLGRSGATAP